MEISFILPLIWGIVIGEYGNIRKFFLILISIAGVYAVRKRNYA